MGGKATLGRAMGYRDGAFIGQMLRGERPITEKTIRELESLTGKAGWFETVEKSTLEPAVTMPPPNIAHGRSVHQVMQDIAALIIELDSTDRKIVSAILGDFALAPEQLEMMSEKLDGVISRSRHGATSGGEVKLRRMTRTGTR